MKDVVVLGAGMAGVAAARELSARGLDVQVLEARDRVGGRIHSVRDFCASPVEGGAEFIHGKKAEHWPEVRRAAVHVRPCPQARDALFDLGSGPRWLPLVLLHPGVWPSFTILRDIRRLVPPDHSAREFLERRGFRGRARILAELTLTAHLPGSADEIGMLGLLEDRVLDLETGSNYRVDEGYDAVVRHMAQGLDVRFGFRVATVEWSSDGVSVRSDSDETVEARAAVSTLPVGVIKSGRVRFAPELPESKKTALRFVEMGPVLKILLRFEERFWPRRAASIVSAKGPVTLYWPVFYRVTDGPAVLTAYCTGPRAAALGRMSEEEAVKTVLEDLRRMFPKGVPKLVDARRIDWTSDPFSCGGYTFLRPGGTGARARLAAADTGALFWAGSATATTTIAASVQGAYVSGLRAAGEVARFLGKGSEDVARTS
ncbi:MAG: hypothetical protein KatS3mg076_2121 [Candidatus Binatia bacterium]|nr:MAG: hypothetical protein KatS3mg076_2121 [Candidatus Binatia bacterium]